MKPINIHFLFSYLSNAAVPLTEELLSIFNTGNNLSLSGSFSLCLDDGSHIGGTYKINVEDKICLVSIYDAVDTQYVDNSNRNDEGCSDRQSDQPNVSSSYGQYTEESNRQKYNNMARVVIDILCSVSETQARSKTSHKDERNQTDQCSIETDNSGTDVCYGMNIRQTSYSNAAKQSIHDKHNVFIGKDSDRTLPSDVFPNQHNNLHDSVEYSNEKILDDLNLHQKCMLHDDKAEEQHVSLSDIYGSKIPCDDQDGYSPDRKTPAEFEQSSNISVKSTTNMNNYNGSSPRHTDNSHEPNSKNSTSRETDWSLKKIMDDYDERFPDEDDEVSSYHSMYYCGIKRVNANVLIIMLEAYI